MYYPRASVSLTTDKSRVKYKCYPPNRSNIRFFIYFQHLANKMDADINDVLNYKTICLTTEIGRLNFRISPSEIKLLEKDSSRQISKPKTTNYEEEDIWEDFVDEDEEVNIQEKNGQFMLEMGVPK